MTAPQPDAQLVAAHLDGDAGALGTIYDRYADPLHDTAAAMLDDRHDAADVTQDVFLIAAQRMGQLRDPDRLKPWLFAILRNEVYRRTTQRTRTVATDFSADGHDMTDDRGAGTEADGLAGEELAALVRGAARGLDERDQLLLELSVRQGLEGQDLADALGVSANKSYTLVHRMRERVSRSLGAFCVATKGRGDCDELGAMLASWDGEFSVLVRKRVARHIERCETCGATRSRIAPLALYAAAPIMAAPVGLRGRVLGAARAVTPTYGFTAADGFPKVVNSGWKFGWIAPTAAASALVAASVAGFALLDDGGDSAAESRVTTTLGEPRSTTTTTTSADTAIPPPPTTRQVVPAAATSTTTPTITARSTTTTTTTATTTAPSATAATTPAPPARPTVTVPLPPAAPTVTVPVPPATAAPTTSTTTTTTITTTTTTLPPGRLTATGGLIDLGPAATSGAITIANDGGQPIDWALDGDVGPFVVQPAGGTLAPGESVDVIASLSIDRATAPEGDLRSGVLPDGTPGGLRIAPSVGDALPLSLVASVERKPFLSPKEPLSGTYDCNGWTDILARVEVLEESSVVSATFVYTDPTAATVTVNLSDEGTTNPGPNGAVYTLWSAITDTPTPILGSWTWSFRAVDGRGNVGDAGGSMTIVDGGAPGC